MTIAEHFLLEKENEMPNREPMTSSIVLDEGATRETERKEGSVSGKRRRGDSLTTRELKEKLRNFQRMCEMNNESKRGLTEIKKGSGGKANGNPDEDVEEHSDGFDTRDDEGGGGGGEERGGWGR